MYCRGGVEYLPNKGCELEEVKYWNNTSKYYDYLNLGSLAVKEIIVDLTPCIQSGKGLYLINMDIEYKAKIIASNHITLTMTGGWFTGWVVGETTNVTSRMLTLLLNTNYPSSTWEIRLICTMGGVQKNLSDLVSILRVRVPVVQRIA